MDNKTGKEMFDDLSKLTKEIQAQQERSNAIVAQLIADVAQGKTEQQELLMQIHEQGVQISGFLKSVQKGMEKLSEIFNKEMAAQAGEIQQNKEELSEQAREIAELKKEFLKMKNEVQEVKRTLNLVTEINFCKRSVIKTENRAKNRA